MSPPNQITLLRILLTPVFLLLLFSESPLNKQLAVGVFILAALTDWYDGYVARKWGYITQWGKFFDPLADKVLTSAAFISFIIIGYAEWWMVLLIVLRDICITLLRSYAELKNTPIDTSGFAKTKTLFQLFVIYYFLVAYIVQNSPEFLPILYTLSKTLATPKIMFWLMLLATFLTLATGISYLFYNWKIIKENH